MGKQFKMCPAILGMATLLSFGASAEVRYVSPDGTGDGSSWANASGDIQAMIDASASGDEVWVAAGTYKPTSLINSSRTRSYAFLLKDGVSLFGGFKGNESDKADREKGAKPYEFVNETILSADDDVEDVWTRVIDQSTTFRWGWQVQNNIIPGTANNSNHVVYCASAFTEPTVIDGLTLTGANADVYQVKAAGGAVYALGTVALNNCKITENSAYYKVENMTDSNTYGGAVYLDGGSMDGCFISKAYSHSSYGNGVGGGVYAKNGTISNCDFEDCVGFDGGGAIYVAGGSLDNCTFKRCYGSSGGAIYNNGAKVSNVDVFDCRALHGGGIFNNGSLTNALVRNCYADAPEYNDMGGKGGALYNRSGDVVNCAFFNNSSFQGGGAFIDNGRIINSTIVNNSIREGGEGENVLGTTSSVLNTIFDANTVLGNFVNAPAFAGSAAGDESKEVLIALADFSLAAGSEFIDSGDAVEGFTAGTDLAGNPRVVGAAIDRGAYEFQATTEVVPTIVLTFAPETTSARLGIGTDAGYEFSIDWGNGELVDYSAEGYLTHDITGSTVKIYGSEILQLLVNSQNIIAADVANAENLSMLQIQTNGLMSLKLGSHPKLTGIYAAGNELKSIDVAGCPALRVLDLNNNSIQGLVDCSGMNQLSKVDISYNAVSSLLLPKTTTLYEIDASYNMLTELDVTGLSGLSELSAAGNALTSIDLSGLTSVEDIYLGENQLNSIDISPCSSLETLQVAENNLSDIDLSHNPTLTGVYLQDNEITSINLSNNPNIRWLNMGNNKLSEIDVTNQKFSILILNNNNLSSIDLSSQTNLSSLDLSDNKLTSVNVSKASYLSQFHIENNALTELDLSGNSYLYGLFVFNNELTTLDLSKNTYLQRLEAQYNNLTGLDVTKNTGLQEVLLQNNKFDAEAIDALINALPDVSKVTVTPETSFLRQLNISYMPGTEQADITPAENKGWFVTAEYDQASEGDFTSLNIQINRAGDAVYSTGGTTVTWNDDDHTSFTISDFAGSGIDVRAFVQDDNTVTIPPTYFGYAADYSGMLMLVSEADVDNQNPMAFAANITGYFNDGVLVLDAWNVVNVGYYTGNFGTVYPTNLTSEFVVSNGTLEYTYESGSTATCNVYVAVKSDTTTEIYNWGGYGYVTMACSDNQWTINSSEVAVTYDDVDYYLSSAEGGDLTSTAFPTLRRVEFGAWTLSSASGKTLRQAENAVLTVDFDLPNATGVDTPAIDKTPVSVWYYNAAGVRSDVPFRGINIVEKTYDDGTRVVTKVRM